MVSGLLRNVDKTATGMLTRNTSASNAACIMCPGNGTNAMASPSENAGTTVLRRMPQRRWSCSRCRNGPMNQRSAISWRLNANFLKNRLGIDH